MNILASIEEKKIEIDLPSKHWVGEMEGFPMEDIHFQSFDGQMKILRQARDKQTALVS